MSQIEHVSYLLKTFQKSTSSLAGNILFLTKFCGNLNLAFTDI